MLGLVKTNKGIIMSKRECCGKMYTHLTTTNGCAVSGVIKEELFPTFQLSNQLKPQIN